MHWKPILISTFWEMPFLISNGEFLLWKRVAIEQDTRRTVSLALEASPTGVDRSSETEPPRTSWRSSWVSTKYSLSAAFSWDVVVTVCFLEHLQPCWIDLQSSPTLCLHREFVCQLKKKGAHSQCTWLGYRRKWFTVTDDWHFPR